MTPPQERPGLSLAEWLVLCLVSEGPTHGFAIAGLLAEDGRLGRVWHVQKAVAGGDGDHQDADQAADQGVGQVGLEAGAGVGTG